MKKFLLILCAALCLTSGAEAKKKKKQPVAAPTAVQPVSNKGLFNVVRNGADWFFEIPDSLIGRRFLVTVRYTSTPGGTDKYGGELVNQQTVYWQKAPNDQLLLRSELLINAADSVDAINRAVISSNENPIIGSFKIEKKQGKNSKIKVSGFFNEDNPALGVSSYAKSAFGLQAYLPMASYIESIKTFPLNTEIRTVKTWATQARNTYAGAFTGKVTIGLNVSFVLLPEVPMQRRFFDPRVGYFADDFNYFSDNQQRVQNKSFITRWRLEPKDSADAERMKRGELVEPKKPIVYYIDPATPKQWRPYLIQGVNDWQKAFEKAGFKNAIIGKEWPENDSTMSMEDARFSVIRYLASPIPNAYGPNVHDPRSGEILESHICWYHNVMTLVHDWYMIQAGTIDEAAQKMKYDEDLMGQLIRFVSSHEVGHTLGLRHNFGSSSCVPVDSLRSKAWVEAHGHTPSIMDYARFNYVAQPEDSISRTGIFPRIGEYDDWAIRWGYAPMFEAYDDESDRYELNKLTTAVLKDNPRLWFGDGETNTTNDSRCQTEDLGDDAVKASDYGILNLKRELKALPEWTYEGNDFFGNNLKSMHRQITTQFLRYVYHVNANIAGVYKDQLTMDEEGSVYTNVSRDKQRYALDFLDRHIFNEPRWLIDQDYAGRLFPEPQDYTINIGKQVLAKMLNTGRLNNMNKEYPADDYLSDIAGKLFKEVKSGAKVTAYRRALQTTYVAALIAYFNFYELNAYGESRPAVLNMLTSLKKQLSASRVADAPTKAHYASLVDVITRALAVK